MIVRFPKAQVGQYLSDNRLLLNKSNHSGKPPANPIPVSKITLFQPFFDFRINISSVGYPAVYPCFEPIFRICNILYQQIG
jgi:hypothetical protein